MKKILLSLVIMGVGFLAHSQNGNFARVNVRDSVTSLTNNTNLNLYGKGSGKVNIEGQYNLPSQDGTNGQVLTTDGAGNVTFEDGGGSGVSFGSKNQIPFMNAGGDDFDYSANFFFSGVSLTIEGVGIDEFYANSTIVGVTGRGASSTFKKNQIQVRENSNRFSELGILRQSPNGVFSSALFGNNSLNSTMEGLSLIGSIGISEDVGAIPVVSIGAYKNASYVSEVITRPTLAGYNGDTKQWEVSADGDWDFQGNELNNASVVSSSSSLEFQTNGTNVALALDPSQNATFSSLGTGAVYSNGGTLTNTNPSDERLKEEIDSVCYGLDEILELQPKRFNYIGETPVKHGYIAQDVLPIMPEFVTTFTKDSTEYYGLDTEAINVIVVKAIQEMNAKIDSLESRIEILENR